MDRSVGPDPSLGSGLAAFTLCVLCHGDYPYLAKRCLDSISRQLDPAYIAEIRVGLNAVSPATAELIFEWADVRGARSILYDDRENIGKYPMMRRMFYDSDYPLRTPYVWWFDDDSYVLPHDFNLLRGALDWMAGADLMGQRWCMALRGGQQAWIESQPWYTGIPVPKKICFPQGACWVARVDKLKEVDYPWPELNHQGGDLMLGAVAAQQCWATHWWGKRIPLAINADEAGRDSRAARRGLSGKTTPIGVDYRK
jgi:hypothetical protein